MSRATVEGILDKIKQLPDEDRLLFDQLLVQNEEQEWREEAARAREAARNRAIDQAAIDRAVHAVRHGG